MAETFIDLAALLLPLEGTSVTERILELQRFAPWTGIVAVGGFPIVTTNGDLQWCGSEVTPKRVGQEVRRGLGLSGMLTYMNKSKLNYDQLGELCSQQGHDWGYRWITFSVLFVGFGLRAELSFTRDSRFLMSWPLCMEPGNVFVATTSVKEWKRFLQHRRDPDWDEASQRAMLSAYDTLSAIPLS